MDGEAVKFLEEHVARVRPVYKESMLADWDANISGSDEDFERSEKLELALIRIYNEQEGYDRVRSLLSGPIEDPLIKRQLEILHKSYRFYQGDSARIEEMVAIDTEIEQSFNTFRAKLGRKRITENDVLHILRKSRDDSLLRRTWKASKKVGELIEADIIKLAKMRNQHARNLGFRDFYEFSLECDELDSRKVAKTMDDVYELTRRDYDEAKRRIDSCLSETHGIAPEELKPWHYKHPFFQEVPNVFGIDLNSLYRRNDVLEIGRSFFNRMDMPIEDILKRSSLFEQEGKCEHAFAMDMDGEGDVRLLMNLKNDEHWMWTFMHEGGHGIEWKLQDFSLPFHLRGSSHTLTTEAVAIFFEQFSKDRGFLSTYVKGFDSSKIGPNLESLNKINKLVFSRWAQVVVRFEQELYRDPDQDLNRVWWDLVRKYQGINFSRDAPDWASKIHIATSPVYYQDYVLGELYSAQLEHGMQEAGIDWKAGGPETGRFLTENVFRHGQKYRWDELIRRSTGENLQTKYWLEKVRL